MNARMLIVHNSTHKHFFLQALLEHEHCGKKYIYIYIHQATILREVSYQDSTRCHPACKGREKKKRRGSLVAPFHSSTFDHTHKFPQTIYTHKNNKNCNVGKECLTINLQQCLYYRGQSTTLLAYIKKKDIL